MAIGRISRAVVTVGAAGATAFMAFTGMSTAATASPVQQHVTAAAPVQEAVATPKSTSDCYSGQVCIYAGESFNGKPTNSYTAYKTYKLYDQYGYHYIYNHQTGGAKFKLCTGSNGTGCTVALPPGAGDINLTPYNSIVLLP